MRELVCVLAGMEMGAILVCLLWGSLLKSSHVRSFRQGFRAALDWMDSGDPLPDEILKGPPL